MKEIINTEVYKKGLSESNTIEEKVEYIAEVVEKLIDVINKHNEVLHVQGSALLSAQQALDAISDNIKNLNSRI